MSLAVGTASLWAIFVSAFVSSTLAPGGSEAILAFLVTQKAHQVETLVITATCGNTLGAITTWGLGSIAARKYPVATLLPVNKQEVLAFVKMRGKWVLFFSWLPIVGDLFCFAAGWLKLSLTQGVLLIFTGKLCRYIFVAWLFTESIP